MATVRSVWPNITMAVDGLLPAAEWTGAGILPIPAGWLLVKNDADSVYIALDLPGDTGNDAGTNDYYWLVLDLDGNGAVTPNRDVLYSPWPSQPNRLGRWLMAGPNTTWPAPNTQVLASSNHIGFAPTPRSAANHRIWELRLKLSELGITIDPAQPPPVLHFGLRVASATPGFVYEYPASPLSAFNNFHQIILATSPTPAFPPGTAGVVIGGVGFIPATLIGADGYATITMPYRIMPDEAAFGGVIDLIGNTATLPALWAAGARKYRVLHRAGNTPADLAAAVWAPIRQSWSNFRWTGITYVWEAFAPDAADMYPFVDPALDYSIKALLFEWTSTTFSNNLHQFQVQFFNPANAVVPTPAQTITLRLDNQLPTVKLVDILHNGVSVAPCAIENMADASDGLQFVFTAFDPEGDLANYALTAEYGAGGSALIASDAYAAHRVPSHIWQGVTNLTQPVSPGKWVPPYTCAYLFRIAATARVTNGYDWPYGWVSDFRTVTLIKPGPRFALKAVPAGEALPFGFAARDKIQVAGVEPQKLGA
jgi:hypothetical protein